MVTEARLETLCQESRHDVFSPVEFTKLIAIACIVFFGLCGVYGLIKLFDAQPGLIVSSKGVLDNSSAVSVGWISWIDIGGFEAVQIKLTKFLVLVVDAPSKYYRYLGSFKRMMMKMNGGIAGSPITISSNSLSRDSSQLREILESNFQNTETNQVMQTLATSRRP